MNDATPTPGQFSLQKTDIDRLRKTSDISAFQQAYKIDPGFRKAFDYYNSPEVRTQLDPYMQQNLQSKLLNRYYYGDWEVEPVDDMTATMAQSATAQPPEQGILGKIGSAAQTAYGYAQAPIQTTVGLMERGLNAAIKGVTGKDTNLVNDAPFQKVEENARKTGQIAPAVLGLAGSAAGPLGTAAGTFAGQGVKQAIDASLGENKMTPLEQVKTPVIEGAIAGTVDYGFGKLAKGLESAVKWAGAKMPKRIIDSLIKAGEKESRFGKDPANAIVQEGIVATSFDDLLTKVSRKADDIGASIQRSIEEASSKNPPQIDVTGAISGSLDDAIKKLSDLEKTNAPAIQTLQNLKDDLVKSYGGTHTPLGAWEAKRAIQGQINWSGDVSRNEINRALWDAFSAIGTQLDNTVPGLAALNKRYSEMIAAKTSIARRATIAQRANMVGLQALGSGLLGTTTLATTGDLNKSLAAAGAGVLGTKALGSTLAKTGGAQAVNGLTKAGLSALNTAKALAPAERFVLLQALQQLFGNDNQESPQ